MLIVNLQGGLGNQMFQYAFAKACEEKMKEKVFFDFNWFEASKKAIVNDKNETANGVVMREYALSLFNIDIPIAPNKEIQKNKVIKSKLPGFLRKIFNIPKYRENGPTENYYCEFNPKLLSKRKSGYYSGYFQNEKYFKNIASTIKKDFELPDFDKKDEYNNNLFAQIKDTNSIMLHIRQGDYVNLGIQINIEYYKEAIKHITSKIEDPTFFIFGQTTKEFIEQIFEGENLKYIIIGDINYNNKEDWKDFKLMIECKHSIIANSSFSWWATWLKEYEGKITVAPTPWLHEIDEIIPDRWHKINLNKG